MVVPLNGKLLIKFEELALGQSVINPVQDGLSRDCSRMRGQKGLPPLFLKSTTHILQ